MVTENLAWQNYYDDNSLTKGRVLFDKLAKERIYDKSLYYGKRMLKPTDAIIGKSHSVKQIGCYLVSLYNAMVLSGKCPFNSLAAWMGNVEMAQIAGVKVFTDEGAVYFKALAQLIPNYVGFTSAKAIGSKIGKLCINPNALRTLLKIASRYTVYFVAKLFTPAGKPDHWCALSLDDVRATTGVGNSPAAIRMFNPYYGTMYAFSQGRKIKLQSGWNHIPLSAVAELRMIRVHPNVVSMRYLAGDTKNIFKILKMSEPREWIKLIYEKITTPADPRIRKILETLQIIDDIITPDDDEEDPKLLLLAKYELRADLLGLLSKYSDRWDLIKKTCESSVYQQHTDLNSEASYLV